MLSRQILHIVCMLSASGSSGRLRLLCTLSTALEQSSNSGCLRQAHALKQATLVSRPFAAHRTRPKSTALAAWYAR